MPRVLLNKVDSKISVAFDTGDHVLGRGAKLLCDNKKVSRNHAVLKIDNAGVFLRSTHNNPCFHRTNQNVSIVTFGNSVQINNDDNIALSLEHGWFKVLIQPENTPKLAEANSEIVTNGLHVDTHRKRSITSETTDSNNKKIKIDTTSELPETEIKLEPLDDTVLQSANQTELCAGFTRNLQCAVVNPRIVQVEQAENLQSSDAALDIFLRAAEASGVSENLQNAVEPPGVSANLENADMFMRAEAASGVPETVPNTVVTPEITPQTEEDLGGNLQNAVTPADTASKVQIKIEPVDNVNTTDSNTETAEVKTEIKEEPEDDKPEEDKPSTSGTNNRVWRDRCWYGKTCYRKNVGHRAEFRHFGDSDYDSDSNDSRPICCYGAGCYRKNSEHRRKYRHPGQDRLPQKPKQAAPTAPPNPPKRRKAKAKKQATPDYDDLDSEEEFDFSGGSSDDYEPNEQSDTESDSDHEDSTQDIAKEAKKLVKYAKKQNK